MRIQPYLRACFPVVTTRECVRFMSSSQNFKFKLGFDWVPIYSFRGLLVKMSSKFDCPVNSYYTASWNGIEASRGRSVRRLVLRLKSS